MVFAINTLKTKKIILIIDKSSFTFPVPQKRFYFIKTRSVELYAPRLKMQALRKPL